MATVADKLVIDSSLTEHSNLVNNVVKFDFVSINQCTSCKTKMKRDDDDDVSPLLSTDCMNSDYNALNSQLQTDSIYNNNDIALESLNDSNDACERGDCINGSVNDKNCRNEILINKEDIKMLVTDNQESKLQLESDCAKATENTMLEEENNKNSCTDILGLELAFNDSNIIEPDVEDLCPAMDSVVNLPVNIDVKLQDLIKGDSTDMDVSFSESLSSESDKDACSSLMESYSQQLKEIENKFKSEVYSLQLRVTELEKEASHEECQNTIVTMEKTIKQLQLELDLSHKEHGLDSRTFAKEKVELEAKVENLKKDYLAANKDREAAVVRYACGEMELMNHKKERELAEKKLKDAGKEKEVLINKLKTLTSDKARVCQMLDNKCSELTVAQKEIDNLKEEVNSRDIKLKWVQNKLRSETDSRKELETKLETLNSKVQDALQEADRAKQEALESIKQFQESEENKAYTIGQQLKEERVKLMLIEHDRDESDVIKKQLLIDLEVCRSNLKSSLEENNSLAVKVQVLEKERLEYEQNLSQLKHKTDTQNRDIVELQQSVKDMEALRIQLSCEQERVSSSQLEMERLRQSNLELLQDMESCRKRESDMLEFTQKLTAKNVRLQSEFTAVEAKVQQLECEEAPLQKKITEMDSKVTSLTKNLEKEKLQRIEESKVLARHLAEKTARVKTLESQVEELTNEIQLVKRKDAATIKELNRELAQMRRRFESNESGSGSDSLCQGSRTSSCTSLNDHSTAVTSSASSNNTNSVLKVEPNRQALIERIGKLQRENAKSVEKVEFLEEHTRTLVEELQKKSKVLQNYMLREDAGALSSNSMDFNKAELTKHGGIMASVYGSKALDEHMTLDLSLEINRKLQAVLEDTLLKNITLKENIDTLGDEIARLSRKKPQL